jgi:hypothetical protein
MNDRAVKLALSSTMCIKIQSQEYIANSLQLYSRASPFLLQYMISKWILVGFEIFKFNPFLSITVEHLSYLSQAIGIWILV